MKQFSLKKIQQIIDISINSFEKNISIINNNKRLSFFEIFFLYHTTNDFLIFNYSSAIRLHCFTNNLIIRRLCKNNQFVFVRFFVIQSFVKYAKTRFVYNIIESREITFFVEMTMIISFHRMTYLCVVCFTNNKTIEMLF